MRRLRYKFEGEPLTNQIKQIFAVDTTLGSEKLRTLLLLVMRNATTDSPWPISNNPYARYNDRARKDCNLNFPLWQLVRASTAARLTSHPKSSCYRAPIPPERGILFSSTAI